MKLGEALALRARLQLKLSSLQNDITSNLTVLEGEDPIQDPNQLRAELDKTAEDLIDLITRINQTNADNYITISDDLDITITEALARRDVLGKLQLNYSYITNQVQNSNRYVNNHNLIPGTPRTVFAIDGEAARRKAAEIAEELARLDILLQQTNWTLDINKQIS